MGSFRLRFMRRDWIAEVEVPHAMRGNPILHTFPGIASEAFEAARSENHHRVLALLHNVDAPGAALLRAKAWVRLGAYDRAIDECNRRSLSSYDAQEAVQLAIVLAEARLENSERERALGATASAKELAAQSGETLLIAYAHYCDAAFAFMLEDFSRARLALASAEDTLSTVPNATAARPFHLDRTGLWKKVLDLKGWCYAQEGDYQAQERCLIQAAAETVERENVDHRIEMTILRNLAAYVYRWPSLEARNKLIECAAKQNWSPYTDVIRTRIRSALQNSERLFGYRKSELSLGSDTAPSLSLRLRDCVSALLVGEWIDRNRYIEECRFGVSLAFEITTDEHPESDAADILELAAVVAPFDVLIAHRILEIYEARRACTSRIYVHIYSPAASARKSFVEGSLAKANGHLKEAALKFDECLDLSRAAGGDYLSAIAGLENYSITRRLSDLEPAKNFIRDFPKSNFSARLCAALEVAPTCRAEDFSYLGRYAPSLLVTDP